MVPAATLRVLAYGESPLACLLLVEPHQVGIGHVDFAADFEHCRRVFAAKLHGHIAERANVVRDVVADAAVAARRRLLEPAVFISGRDRHAVDLELDDPLDFLAGEQLFGPLAVCLQLLDAVGVVDREHRHPMRDRMQLRDRAIADPLRGAVGRDQLGMLRFELLEPLEQPIVLSIVNLGRRLDVVFVIVMADLLAELFDLVSGGHGG